MLFRFLSYLFSLLFGLFASGLSAVLLISGSKNYKFDMLPWFKQETALYVLLGLGLAGVVAAVMAVLGRWKPLLVAFTLVAFILLVYGFFVSPVYRFHGAEQAKAVAWLSLASLGAFLGALMQYYPQRERS